MEFLNEVSLVIGLAAQVVGTLSSVIGLPAQFISTPVPSTRPVTSHQIGEWESLCVFVKCFTKFLKVKCFTTFYKRFTIIVKYFTSLITFCMQTNT